MKKKTMSSATGYLIYIYISKDELWLFVKEFLLFIYYCIK